MPLPTVGGNDGTWGTVLNAFLGGGFAANRIPFMNSGGTDLTSSTNLVFDGTTLTIPATVITASAALTLTPAAGTNLNIALSSTGDFVVNTNQLYVDTSAGTVGIGTTVPASLLHVDTQSVAVGLQNVLRLETEQGTVNDEIGILFKIVTNIDAAAIRSRITAAGDKSLSFYTSTSNTTDGSSLTEKLTITHDGTVGIGTTGPAASALLDLTSTTAALLVPRMTTTQRDALTAVNGMIIYNTTTATMQGFINSAWANM